MKKILLLFAVIFCGEVLAGLVFEPVIYHMASGEAESKSKFDNGTSSTTFGDTESSINPEQDVGLKLGYDFDLFRLGFTHIRGTRKYENETSGITRLYSGGTIAPFSGSVDEDEYRMSMTGIYAEFTLIPWIRPGFSFFPKYNLTDFGNGTNGRSYELTRFSGSAFSFSLMLDFIKNFSIGMSYRKFDISKMEQPILNGNNVNSDETDLGDRTMFQEFKGEEISIMISFPFELSFSGSSSGSSF